MARYQPDLFPVDAVELELAADIARKHVNALAIVPGERKISFLGRKLYNVLLHVAQTQGMEQDFYQAPLRDLIRHASFDSHDYGLLKKTLKQLIATVVEWQSPTDGEFHRWDACGMLAGASLSKDRSGAITLSWSYAPQIKTQLLSPDRYARLSLQIVSALRSYAALALYEICVRYVDNPSHLTARQAWRWWRPVLTGNPGNDKGEYRYFKRDVLAPAMAEINANTDIEIRRLIETKGPDNKTITDLQFEVHRKSAGHMVSERLAAPPEPVDLGLVSEAMQLGLKQEEAERLLQDFGREALAAGLARLRNRQAQPEAGPVNSPARWLKTVMPAPGGLSPKAPEASRPATRAPAAPKRQAKWLEEWMRRQHARLRAEFASLPLEAQGRVLAEYGQALAQRQSPLLKRFTTHGWAHAMVVGDFTRWWGLRSQGEGWDKPSADALLSIAAEVGDEPHAAEG